ncbi:MAG: M24 family metallopeptidase [Actinomycetota bacterium]
MQASRIQRARAALARIGCDALMVGPSADLRYLCRYPALPLERMTLLVVGVDSDPFLIVPELEVLRARSFVKDIEIIAFSETQDPVAIVSDRTGPCSSIAAGDRLWTMFTLRLQRAFESARWIAASSVLRDLRARKDAEEIDALSRSAAAADRVAAILRNEKVSGRKEREVSRWISDELISQGCEQVNFAIVASGPNAASPHHEPADRVIQPGDSLVCDFGGTLDGYCSDITRTFFVGEPPNEFVALYEVLHRAQVSACDAVASGVPAEKIDAVARELITEAGYGESFIHRTGHGIGIDEHEDPYLVAGNTELLEPGMAFSIEPGIYIPGSYGARIEDIVVCEQDRGRRLNTADRELVILR